MLIEAVFEVEQREAEGFADRLLEAGALSVAVEDADVDSIDEQPLFGEPGTEPAVHAWRRSRLTALLDGDGIAAALASLAAELDGVLPAPLETREVDEQDWVTATQAQFDPITIGRLVIVPSWHEVPAGAEIVIRLDPGMAFGTGSHPTTQLCLEWLERCDLAGRSVLDYGCGSGILAIGAAKLGAASVEGLDIDTDAVVAARANAATNGVVAQFHDADWRDGRRYDIVVANILSNPLKVLAPALIAKVSTGGALVLSGVLERQADEVMLIYRQNGFSLELAGLRDGWACLAGHGAPA
ncbi:50S ribosomal protein L11 methyltransferase [soil metagenome]